MHAVAGISHQRQCDVKKIPHGKFVLLPVGENTHGHGTHTWAVAWQQYLRELLEESAPRR